MKIVDPGHLYELLPLDGVRPQVLRFVKRNEPAGLYPGNDTAYPGTTSQQVLLALMDRSSYVQRQFWCMENLLVLLCLRIAFWLLEFRASRRRRVMPHLNPWTAWRCVPCACCLHIRCARHG